MKSKLDQTRRPSITTRLSFFYPQFFCHRFFVFRLAARYPISNSRSIGFPEQYFIGRPMGVMTSFS